MNLITIYFATIGIILTLNFAFWKRYPDTQDNETNTFS